MIRGTVTREDLTALLAVQKGPCLSLYQPTHRRHPENQQDPVRFKNLLKTLEESLLRQHTAKEAEALLAPFREAGVDKTLWNQTWDGLAVVGCSEFFQIFRLQRPVPELAVVAGSFHIKPLLRVLQSADRYQVLSLNRREIKLFEGNRDQLDEVQLAPGVPRTITEALGSELTEPHQTVGSHGGTALGSSMRHGHGSKQDEVDIDDERFFRAVDRAVLEHQSRPSGLPLIVAALAQHQGTFRKVSHNPFLAEGGIEADPSALSADQIRQRAWSVVEPGFRSRLKRLAETFEEAQAKGLGSGELEEVARAAAESRVGSLLVEAERSIPGSLDRITGRVTPGGLDDPHCDDLLDDLAELVLLKGGEVVVTPAADMPVTTGIAGTFRF